MFPRETSGHRLLSIFLLLHLICFSLLWPTQNLLPESSTAASISVFSAVHPGEHEATRAVMSCEAADSLLRSLKRLSPERVAVRCQRSIMFQGAVHCIPADRQLVVALLTPIARHSLLRI